MKLRTTPEDFIVTEKSRREPSNGQFALYELSKESIGTLEAIHQVVRTWNLAPHQISHAGLKDRHASTSQLITIKHGPRTNCDSKLWNLEYVGQTSSEMTAADIEGNVFDITVRSLAAQQSEQAVSNLHKIAETGYPNYFDDQRFGSVTHTGRFAAERWCKKDYETALWLALAEYNSHDDKDERFAKQILRDLWGNWIQAKAELPKSHRRSVVTYLCDHPTKFRKAFALVNSDLRGLLLSAFQSCVWNTMLKIAIVDDAAGGDQAAESVYLRTIEVQESELPVPDAKVRTVPAVLSLPSGRKGMMDDASIRLSDMALADFHMKTTDMKLSFPRDRWFSKGQRLTMIQPRGLQVEESEDEINVGRRKVRLCFELPRGCYATMLLKTAIPEQSSL
ncbi:MAG: tRNA pseudouridine(13) synthase TruD [Fuerstiella sp.]